MRLRVSSQQALVKPGEHERGAPGFCQSSHIMPVEYDGSERAGKGRLAGSDLIVSESHDWPTRHGHGSRGNASTTMGHFEAKSVDDFVALGLMILHQNRFLGLI